MIIVEFTLIKQLFHPERVKFHSLLIFANWALGTRFVRISCAIITFGADVPQYFPNEYRGIPLRNSFEILAALLQGNGLTRTCQRLRQHKTFCALLSFWLLLASRSATSCFDDIRKIFSDCCSCKQRVLLI